MRFAKLIQILVLIAVAAVGVLAQQNKPMAENFSALSLDGQTVELESLRGKVVVIAFWSTRCAICAAEIPKLNQLAASYKDKDVVFLGVTADNPTLVESYVKNRPFNFNLLPDSFGIVLQYADRDASGNMNMGFPAYYVINQQGQIEFKSNGWDKTNAVNSLVNKLLITGQAKNE